MKASNVLAAQRSHFASGQTQSYDFRIQQLHKLDAVIREMEAEILQALQKDLHKPSFDGYATEVGLVLKEIKDATKNLKKWMRPQTSKTALVFQPGKSRVYSQPRGTVLIMGPWNYPFQLLFAPLVGAIAAGNCVVVKPSELASATEAVVLKLIEKAFSPEYIAVICGGVAETTELLKEQFDYIFFTGSVPVGKVVMRAAAEHLTPVTLELGGKSPCVVDSEVDVEVASRRITWGKFTNAGQICIAPDYLLVHRLVKKRLLGAIRTRLVEFYGADPKKSPDYGRIINQRNFDRLDKMLDGAQIIHGGERDRESRYIAPTIVDNVTLDSAVMKEEIFGPILPVITYDTIEEVLNIIAERPNPLACYVFTRRREFEDRILREVRFGGGCVNNTLIHCANLDLPFGGVRQSGIGAYHGRRSFDTFSHQKGVLHSSFKLDLKLKYPPYKNRMKAVQKLMDWGVL